MWLASGCVVGNPFATTVSGLGRVRPAEGYKSCTVACPIHNDTFKVTLEGLSVHRVLPRTNELGARTARTNEVDGQGAKRGREMAGHARSGSKGTPTRCWSCLCTLWRRRASGTVFRANLF